MSKVLGSAFIVIICCFLSCSGRTQSREKEMKDSLAAVNFIKCAKFLYNSFLRNADLEQQEGHTDTCTNNFSAYDNHPALEVSEEEYLMWVDSTLGVTGVKLIDYRNEVYQYGNTRFYWNRKFNYLLVYPSNFQHGKESYLCDGNHFVNSDSTICLNVYASYFDVFKEDYSLREWLDVLIDSEIEQRNTIEKKDYTESGYVIEGKTKNGRYFYSKAIYKIAYDREIILTVRLEYTSSKKKDAKEIIKRGFSNFTSLN